MNFLDIGIKLLGLDAKAKGVLVGYRTFIILAIAVLLNLGPALIDAGNAMTILGSILGLVLQFADGTLTFSTAIAQGKAQFALITPLLVHINICLAAMAGAYFKASHDRKLSSITIGPAPVEVLDDQSGGIKS